MSEYLPLEVQEEIIKRLTVKSVVQFRSVSKAWKSLIDSPEFISAYSLRHTHPHHLLIRYFPPDMVETDERYVCFVDDDTFPQQRSAPTVPLSVQLLNDSRIVGCSCGLLCLYGDYLHPHNVGRNKMVVLWNPSIRKSVSIDVPNVKHGSNITILGFGVCPITSDPKIVKITHSDMWFDWFPTKSNNIIPWKVEVYTLSSGEWRTPWCNLPRPSIQLRWSQVVIDRFIYWLALDRIAASYIIMSFDMTIDEFREVHLPDSLANRSNIQMTISKVRESLVVLDYGMETDKRICTVWMMEYGVTKSFTKLYTIRTPYASITTLGFKKSGQPIIECPDDFDPDYAWVALVVYEPYSEHNLGIFAVGGLLSMSSYMETLLLLNQ